MKVLIFFFFLFSNLANAKLQEFEETLIGIYQNSVPAVVNVTNIQTVGHPFFGFLEKIPAGQGSGFVWNEKGYIVTNYHVVEGGEDFQVSFYTDKKAYKAKVIGVAPAKDIAVLKLQEIPPKLISIKKGDSKDLKVGQYAIAIGNPFGLDHSMSTGIISAVGRKIMGIGNVKIHDMIQTDAAINQGNSGGPLLNSSGELIGMNTLIYSPSGANAGLGFAVPSDIINKIVPQLIEHGKVIRPSLGISIMQDEVKERFFGKKGVAVSTVVDGGPADKAGIKGLSQDKRGRIFKGDLILKINDKEVNNYDEIYNFFDSYQIGDEVKVTVKREDEIKDFKVKLEAL